MANSTAGIQDHHTVGCIWLLTSSVGLAVNAATALSLLRGSHNQFRLLSLSLAAADCGVLSIFLFWVTPVAFSANQSLATSLVGRKVGQLGLLFWFACLYGTLAISINRFVAIVYPQRYNVWCSMEKTRRGIGVIWVLALIHSLLYFVPGCDFMYDTGAFVFYYYRSKCYDLLVFMDLVYGVTCVIVIFGINLTTLCNLRAYNNRIEELGGLSKDDVIKYRKRETRFFIQACINAAVYVLMILSPFIIAPFFTNKWNIFWSTSFVWALSHTSNGFLLLLFNAEIRNDVKTCFGAAGPSAVVPVQNNPQLKPKVVKANACPKQGIVAVQEL